MATLAPGGRITVDTVEEEIARLQSSWQRPEEDDIGGQGGIVLMKKLIPMEKLEEFDLFDRLQLASVLAVCCESRTLSEAGRKLFAASRTKKATANDADRLRKFLARFGVSWDKIASVAIAGR
jgi:transcriptional regulatory protein RtcR